MKLKGNYYNFHDGWNEHRSMLRPESFVDLEDADYLLISTYDLFKFDFDIIKNYNLELVVDCSTEIAPPVDLLETIPIKNYTLYCNSTYTLDFDDEAPLSNYDSINIIELPFFLKYMEYYTPITTNQKLEHRKFLFMVGKLKKERIALLGLLSYYNLLDNSYFSIFNTDENFDEHNLNDYFTTSAPEEQKRIVKLGMEMVSIPTKLDTETFDYNISHTRQFNADYYNSVDFVVVAESENRENIKFITEKISKCILLNKPFIVVGSAGILKYAKEQSRIHLNRDISHLTDWCDITYDDIEDNWERIEKIVEIIKNE